MFITNEQSEIMESLSFYDTKVVFEKNISSLNCLSNTAALLWCSDCLTMSIGH